MIRETSPRTTPTSSPSASPVTSRKKVTDSPGEGKESVLFSTSITSSSSGVASISPEKEKKNEDEQKLDDNKSKYFPKNSAANNVSSQINVATSSEKEEEIDEDDISPQLNVNAEKLSEEKNNVSSSGETAVFTAGYTSFSSSDSSLSGKAMVPQESLKPISESLDIQNIKSIKDSTQATIFHVESHDRMKIILPFLFNGDMVALHNNGVDDYQRIIKTLTLLEFDIRSLYNKVSSDSQGGGANYKLINKVSLYIHLNLEKKGVFSLKISNGLSLEPSNLIFSCMITNDKLLEMIGKLKINISNYRVFNSLPLFNEDKNGSLEACTTVFPYLSSSKKEDIYTIFCLPCNDRFENKAIRRFTNHLFSKKEDNLVPNTLLGDVLTEYDRSAPFSKKHAGSNVHTNEYSVVIDGLEIPASSKDMHNNLLLGVYACLLHIAKKSNPASTETLNNNNATSNKQIIDLKIYGVGNGAYVAASIYSYVQDLFNNKINLSDLQEFSKKNKRPLVPDIKDVKQLLISSNVKINYYLYLSNPSRGNINSTYDISKQGGLPAPYGKDDNVFIILTNALYGEKDSILNKLHDITSHIKLSDPKRIKLICISEPEFMNATERNNLKANSLSRQLTYKFFGMDRLNNCNNNYKKDTYEDKNSKDKRSRIHKIYTRPIYLDKIKEVLNKSNDIASLNNNALLSSSSSSSNATTLSSTSSNLSFFDINSLTVHVLNENEPLAKMSWKFLTDQEISYYYDILISKKEGIVQSEKNLRTVFGGIWEITSSPGCLTYIVLNSGNILYINQRLKDNTLTHKSAAIEDRLFYSFKKEILLRTITRIELTSRNIEQLKLINLGLTRLKEDASRMEILDEVNYIESIINGLTQQINALDEPNNQIQGVSNQDIAASSPTSITSSSSSSSSSSVTTSGSTSLITSTSKSLEKKPNSVNNNNNNTLNTFTAPSGNVNSEDNNNNNSLASESYSASSSSPSSSSSSTTSTILSNADTSKSIEELQEDINKINRTLVELAKVDNNNNNVDTIKKDPVESVSWDFINGSDKQFSWKSSNDINEEKSNFRRFIVVNGDSDTRTHTFKFKYNNKEVLLCVLPYNHMSLSPNRLFIYVYDKLLLSFKRVMKLRAIEAVKLANEDIFTNMKKSTSLDSYGILKKEYIARYNSICSDLNNLLKDALGNHASQHEIEAIKSNIEQLKADYEAVNKHKFTDNDNSENNTDSIINALTSKIIAERNKK